jgi:hypothetical protein
MENLPLLDQLRKMLVWKKSKKFYADRLGISEIELEELYKELDNGTPSTPTFSNFSVDINEKEGSSQISLKTPTEIKSLDELVEKCKIDTDVWKIDRYVQNYWGNDGNPHWQVKAFLSKKDELFTFQEQFGLYLNSYTPSKPIPGARDEGRNTCLILNKQDAHLNKYDVDGNNDILERFEKLEGKIAGIIEHSSPDEIIYIIGSDEFNSEWHNATTKGTPQQNIHPYQVAFQLICQHETRVIDLLLRNCNKLKVIYIPGNHDEYVGWHLASWLLAHYRNQEHIDIDISPEYTKCLRFSNTAMLFNHGNDMRPNKLAELFPHIFKEAWSACDYHYVFTGDKHTERFKDFSGTQFYQIPALSTAKSRWDKSLGHDSKAYLTAFEITDKEGMTTIFKRHIK